MDLIAELEAKRGLTATSMECLRLLLDETRALPFELNVQKRGHFGDVLRWTRDGKLWFDALPAQHWVLFYFNKRALQLPGLDYHSICARLPHAIERSDLVVKVRLHDKSEALALAKLINAAIPKRESA